MSETLKQVADCIPLHVAAAIKQHADTSAVVALVDYSGDFASPAGLQALAPHGVNTERLLCATIAEHGGACVDEDALDAMAATFEMIASVVVVVRGTDGEWVPELLRCARGLVGRRAAMPF